MKITAGTAKQRGKQITDSRNFLLLFSVKDQRHLSTTNTKREQEA